MKLYEYLVAYNFDKEGWLTPGKGTMCIYRTNKIKTGEDVAEVNKYISGLIEGAYNVGVYNFILLGRKRH